MFLILFTLSLIFVYLHGFLEKKYSWDMLGLQQLNELKYDNKIPNHRIFKRLLKQMMLKGYWWIYFIGALIVGPPIVTILLRREKSLSQNLLYIIPGTLLSVVFWVSIWTGVGIVTWNQFVKPFLLNRLG
ncbi:MAG: hypothetical protein HQK96_15320 [Nitrospirae bacterium]|nr:hypothetical protein [Nitrospirota bacterium]